MATNAKEKQIALEFKRLIRAPQEQVYRAFTNATALREWLCDVATAVPNPGGRLYVWWDVGYYASGEYLSVAPNRKAVFTWHGRGEPAITQVQVVLAPRKDATLVTLTHSGLGSSPEWVERAGVIRRGWEVGLENLQSVLETGVDLRIVRRPMLGIQLGEDLTPPLAAELGVPAKSGVRLSGVFEGMGAHKAGLQKDDVLVGLAGKKVTGSSSLSVILQGKRAGDVLPVVFYRGGQKQTVLVELSGRVIPDIPPTAEAFAEALRRVYAEGDVALDGCLQGVSEEVASRRPAPGEWSAKHVLAHLITSERESHGWIVDQIGSQERWADDYAGNLEARLAATLAVYPTVPDLLDELKRCESETVQLIAALPPEFIARKGSYWRLAYSLLQGGQHIREHVGQIQAAVAAAEHKQSGKRPKRG